MMLQNLMESYLNENKVKSYPDSDKSELPIKPKEEKWSVSTKCIKKLFSFKSRKQKEAFVLELLKYDRDTDCVIEFRVKQKKVGVILHALSSEVSEIEFEAKKDIDKIRKDVVYYFAKKE